MSLQATVVSEFHKRFQSPPARVVRAPGRVNLIGEHTDYNDGFVLPMAIERATYIALRPREDNYVVVHALDFDDTAEFSLDGIAKRGLEWAEYVQGVAWAMQEDGYTLRGWEGVVSGDVPIGAGLSSSAALEMATACAFASVSGLAWDAARMAKIGQRTENGWIGVKSGIMDQMISAGAVEGSALLIDCRHLTLTPAPLPAGTAVVILDTATRRELADSKYNERREQCEAAARFFGVGKLRDVDMTTFIAGADQLEPLTCQRARHVISENARTLQAAAAMRAGDANELGKLMNASHVSMRDDFAISRWEIDKMVELAQAHPGCYGARMTGGGFGGCCVALVRVEQAQAFAESVSRDYSAATDLAPALYISQPSAGAGVVE
ncbi:MAG: galactokinase [Chloroflexota bacterium]|nr:galactokinase [Chloroflexota bacterium]